MRHLRVPLLFLSVSEEIINYLLIRQVGYVYLVTVSLFISEVLFFEEKGVAVQGKTNTKK